MDGMGSPPRMKYDHLNEDESVYNERRWLRAQSQGTLELMEQEKRLYEGNWKV